MHQERDWIVRLSVAGLITCTLSLSLYQLSSVFQQLPSGWAIHDYGFTNTSQYIQSMLVIAHQDQNSSLSPHISIFATLGPNVPSKFMTVHAAPHDVQLPPSSP